MRIISLALRQRIFGAIRTEGNCIIWYGDPIDAMIFRGKKHRVHEISFYLFSKVSEDEEGEILPCNINDGCISPNHVTIHNVIKGRWSPNWDRLKIGVEDRKDILRLHQAGVSKRTLKQWYMLETKELDDMLRITK